VYVHGLGASPTNDEPNLWLDLEFIDVLFLEVDSSCQHEFIDVLLNL
jgi:hypothetical protein